MRGKGVRLLLREDVQVIMILRVDLWEQNGIWGGSGGWRKERRRKGCSSKKGRRRRGYDYPPTAAALILNILQQYHDSPLAGHYGVARTQAVVEKYF